MGPKMGPIGAREPKWNLRGPKMGPVGPNWAQNRIPRGDSSLCALKGCVPSEDLYALKGLVCPQGTCMPSKDLYALKGPVCPQGPWAHMGPAQGAQVP